MSNAHPPLKSVQEAFMACYTRAQLFQFYFPLALRTLEQHAAVFRSQGISARKIAGYASVKNPTKDIIAEAVAIVFSSADGFHAFLDALTEKDRAMWEVMIAHRRITHLELHKTYHIEALLPDTPSNLAYWMKNEQFVASPYRIFFHSIRRVEGNCVFCFSLPDPIRKLLLAYISLPPKAELRAIPAPEATAHRFDAAEMTIHSEWPRILSGWRSHTFSYTVKSRPTAIAKTAGILQLKEFFDGRDKSYRHLRTHLIAGLLAWADFRRMPDATPEGIRYLFQEVYRDRAMSAPWLLIDIKGGGTLNNKEFHRIEPAMFALLTALPSEKWVEADKVFYYAEYRHPIPSPLRVLPEDLGLTHVPNEQDRDPARLGIHAENEEIWLLRSAFYGSFFLFAAYGLVDLAYDSPAMGQAPPWHQLRYVRRTALGDYVTGHREQYNLAPLADVVRPVFSEEGLLITLPDDGHPLASLLAPYTEPVGPGAYRTGAAIFLKGVRSKRDLLARIHMFRQIVGSDLPKSWHSFLQDLEGRVAPITFMPEYLVYEIPPQNQELIRHFARDPVLRKLAVKAEGYRLLIPRTELELLRKRLRELGYLMP